MRRLALLSILLWAPLALAQVEPEPEPSAETPAGGIALQGEGAAATGRTPASEYTDPAEVDFIGRINDAIDTRADATESGEQPRSSGAATPKAARIILRGVFALCIVIALILSIYYGLRRWGKKVPLFAGASLGTVLGRIHLERGTTLHFLRTGGRVLIVGVNGNAVSLVANFDASVFDSYDADREEASEAEATFNPDSFLAQLQASSQAMDPRLKTEETQVDDDEIAALRGDIQRLQRYLREESRESQD